MKKWILSLIILCSIGLLGCQKPSVNDPDVRVEVEAEPQIEETKETVPDEPEDIEEKEPVLVTIIDPNTMEIIHTLSPAELGYDADIAIYKTEIEKIAKGIARGTEESAGYDQRMILDKLDEQGRVVKGSPLILMKESLLVDRILEASATGGTVELPLVVQESGYELEDISHLEEVVVASYTTYFNQNDVGRNKNIELSAMAINNVIIGKGDQFSFNTVVGPRDEENGYQPAPEIINKKLVMGIGGGICQTSSTLFNAIDQIPIKYVERHHHSLDIGYVPKGRDATVSYGGLDFRFQNTNDVPFILKAVYGKNFLTIEIRTSENYKEFLMK